MGNDRRPSRDTSGARQERTAQAEIGVAARILQGFVSDIRKIDLDGDGVITGNEMRAQQRDSNKPAAIPNPLVAQLEQNVVTAYAPVGPEAIRSENPFAAPTAVLPRTMQNHDDRLMGYLGDLREGGEMASAILRNQVTTRLQAQGLDYNNSDRLAARVEAFAQTPEGREVLSNLPRFVDGVTTDQSGMALDQNNVGLPAPQTLPAMPKPGVRRT